MCPPLQGPQLGALSLALRRLVAAVDKNGIAFVFISGSWSCRTSDGWQAPALHHEKGEWGQGKGGGGQALRFFASVRLELERREWIRRGRDVIGCRSTIRVAKNKLAPPLREAEVALLFYRFPPEAPPLQVWHPARKSPSMPKGNEARAAIVGGRAVRL